jgi:hypothetical protein
LFFTSQIENLGNEKQQNKDTLSIKYGKYRGISYDDKLRDHIGDGTELDPIKMIMDDTGFSKERAEQALKDTTLWVGSACGKIRSKEGAYSNVADRIAEFIDASPKYKGTISRGISVEPDTCLDIIDTFDNDNAITQLGISS